MTDLLRKASNWLEGKRKAYAASTVTYYRGELVAEVEATIGSTTFDVETGGGGIETIVSRDFLILRADLELEEFDGGELVGSEVVLPARGDKIKETVGSETFVYEVMAPGGEPPWRYSDPWRKTLRIHTKHVDTE